MFRNQVAHPAGAYPTFHSMKQKKSITTLPWMGCQSMARLIPPPPSTFHYVSLTVCQYPFILLGGWGGWGEALWKKTILPTKATQMTRPCLSPETWPDLFMTFMKLFKPVFFSGLDFRNGRQSWSTPKSQDGQQHWKSKHISGYEVNCFHCNPHYFPQLV